MNICHWSSALSAMWKARGSIFRPMPSTACFGFSYAVNAIEGQTVVLTFPAAVLMALICLWIYWRGRRSQEHNVAALFFLMGFLLSALLFAYWGIAHPGFTEFSELGWI